MDTDNLFDTNKQYRLFAIFGNISAFILLVLVTINLGNYIPVYTTNNILYLWEYQKRRFPFWKSPFQF